MGIWKAKKKQRNEPEMIRCPQCLNSHLRYITQVSGIYTPVKVYCPDCGYSGSIFIDINAEDDDDNEAQELEMLREEFPDLVEEQKSAFELSKITLDDKWQPNQKTNHNKLGAWCPFCSDVNGVCSICKCPKEICSKHATEGLIGKLNDMYDEEIELCEVDSSIYMQIVEKFQKIIKKHSE